MYYALATVDKDGRTQLPPIKIYKSKNALPKLIISLSPNPISGVGHLMLQFNADKKGVMDCKAHRHAGQSCFENRTFGRAGSQ